MNTVPLVVDLDGTLIRSDLLIESALIFAREQPLHILHPLAWLMAGKSELKTKLAEVCEIDVNMLPYEPQVIELIEQERAKGRQIILATASHKKYADKIATHLNLFDSVMATEGGINLSARNKRDKLVMQFGERGFDYAGNSHDDLDVWNSARRAYVVNPESGVEVKARRIGNMERVIVTPGNQFKAWSKALRFHQWMKNMLIFVPLLASHQAGRADLLLNGVLAFLFFGLCASSVYLLNDLLDLNDDRHHSSKRNRPFASGQISIKVGLMVFPFLLAIAFGAASWLLPWRFVAALGGYYLLTVAYSISLKRLIVIDVIALAMLYTLRIVAGTYAFGVFLTFWMLAFSMFIFLSLALVKRYAELREARRRGSEAIARGRGYYPGDLEMISSLGASSGYLSVMVLALYTQDQATFALYRYPHLIWLACPLLLFWISRIWLLTHRGLMHEDPVVFAIKDRVSLVVGALFFAIFWLAS